MTFTPNAADTSSSALYGIAIIVICVLGIAALYDAMKRGLRVVRSGVPKLKRHFKHQSRSSKSSSVSFRTLEQLHESRDEEL